MKQTLVRTLTRSTVAGLFLTTLGTAASALADTPSAWEDSPTPSALQYLLVLFLIPLGIGLVITTLTVLPSLVRGNSASREIEPVHHDGHHDGRHADRP